MENRKRKELGNLPEKDGSMEHKKRKRVKEHINGSPRTDGISSRGGDGLKRAMRGRQFDGIKSFKDQSERSGKTNKENYSKRPTGVHKGRPTGVHKGKMGKMNTGKKDATAVRKPGTTARLFKHKKVGRK